MQIHELTKYLLNRLSITHTALTYTQYDILMKFLLLTNIGIFEEFFT